MISNETILPIRKSKRLSARSWVSAAFRRLAEINAGDIKVEDLAQDLGVTKGSFYWHFRNRQHLLQCVLEHWTERATVRITLWSKSENATVIERLTNLLMVPANAAPDNQGAAIELAVRSWARQDDTAAQFVAKVDQLRYEYFVELIKEIGLSAHQARQRAAIAQAFMLGDAFLTVNMTQTERTNNARACAEMIASSAFVDSRA